MAFEKFSCDFFTNNDIHIFKNISLYKYLERFEDSQREPKDTKDARDFYMIVIVGGICDIII